MKCADLTCMHIYPLRGADGLYDSRFCGWLVRPNQHPAPKKTAMESVYTRTGKDGTALTMDKNGSNSLGSVSDPFHGKRGDFWSNGKHYFLGAVVLGRGPITQVETLLPAQEDEVSAPSESLRHDTRGLLRTADIESLEPGWCDYPLL